VGAYVEESLTKGEIVTYNATLSLSPKAAEFRRRNFGRY
jgi:hypothetical protein